jgi:hypothetical protein
LISAFSKVENEVEDSSVFRVDKDDTVQQEGKGLYWDIQRRNG